MKAVMISIQPKWCEKIASGEKTIEVRKNHPKLETPFKCYIYMTAGLASYPVKINDYPYTCHNGGQVIIGEFVCDRIEWFSVGSLRCDDLVDLACMTYEEMINYFYKPEELDGKTHKEGYAWHISDLKIYDKPKELCDFGQKCKYAQYLDDEYYGGWFCNDEEIGGDCQCFDCPKCSGENNEYEDFAYCLGKGIKPLKRPPQSWGYVEEVEE